MSAGCLEDWVIVFFCRLEVECCVFLSCFIISD
jgi:hypothetical protein